MSKTQDVLERQNKGFRDETTFDGKATVFRDILEYEMLELGNMDIPKYVYTYFCSCLPQNTRNYYSNKFKWSDLFDILQDVANDAYTPTDLRNMIHCNTLLDFIVQVVRDSSFHAYSGELYACWLTTSSACKLYYGKNVSCYELPKRHVVVADIGAEGVLFVATEIINSDKNKIA